jgi:hypothetical protein
MTDRIFIPTNLPYVRVEIDAVAAPTSRRVDDLAAFMPKPLLALVKSIRAKNIHFSFVVRPYSFTRPLDANQLSNLEVLYDGEHSGSVTMRNRWSSGGYKDTFEFTNRRMENERNRRGTPYTTKADVALKNILKYYTALTDREVLNVANTVVDSKLRNREFYSPNQVLSYVTQAKIADLLAQREDIASTIRDAGIDIPKDLSLQYERSLLRAMLENKPHRVVVRRKPDTGELVVFAEDEGVLTRTAASPQVSTACAMLSMSPNPVAWLGVRADENTFALLKSGLDRIAQES